MAEHLMLEQAMIDGLEAQYKTDKAQAFKSRYFAAKSKLFDDILQWIRSNEPQLSDHSQRHIENVLDNIYKLICEDIADSQDPNKYLTGTPLLTGLDLYFLCQVALFHDVGNFYGRNKHNQKITDIIKKAFEDLFSGEHRRERKLIAEAGRVHTGKGMDGSDDSLSDLRSKSEHIQGDHIHYCSIAAIIRFADELAEGPQRTSAFMQEEGKILEENLIYHKYASCTHIKIDAPNHRVSISYEINIDTESDKTSDQIEAELRELLEFIYGRIIKLDQERKYFNYYNEVTTQIKEVQVIFNFQKDDYDLDFKIEPLILNDLVVPGKCTNFSPLTNHRKDLEIDNVVSSVSKEVFDEGEI